MIQDIITDNQVYQEIYEIIKYSSDIYLMKIPEDILKFIIENRDKTYKSRIDEFDIENINNVNKRTIDLLAWLEMEYVLEGKEKDEFIATLKENDLYEEELKSKMYSTNVFNSNKEVLEEKIITEQQLITLEEEKGIRKIFKMIVTRIRELF